MALKSSYLDPFVLARIGRLKVRAEKVVEGFLSGLHQSPYRGISLEFAQHRQYSMGDEIKHIDWKVYARTDRFFIKQFEQETNLRLYILLDASGSMRFKGSQSPLSKFEYAATLAASLAYLTVNQGDSAGLGIFSPAGPAIIPARSSVPHLNALLEELENAKPSGPADWARSLTELIPTFQKRSLFILISDLLGEESEAQKALKLLAFKRHEVAVIHLLDSDEKNFPYRGAIQFQSTEDGGKLTLDAEDYREEYDAALQNLIHYHRVGCRRSGIRYQLHTTQEPLDRILRFLLSGEKG